MPTTRPRAILGIALSALVAASGLIAAPAEAMPNACYLLCLDDLPGIGIAGPSLGALQGDGSSAGDASNRCNTPSPVITTPVNTDGSLGGAAGDSQDNYDLRISATNLPNVRVEVNARLLNAVQSAVYHDLDLYVWSYSGTACMAVVASNSGTSVNKVVTFPKGAASRFVVQIVDAGLRVRGLNAAVCGSGACLEDPAFAELDTMCYPACRQLNPYTGYLLKAQSTN